MDDLNFIKFEPIWFDSFGAKSSSLWVETPDVKLVIDPGIAAMQPSFPASIDEKLKWKEEGRRRIKKFCEKASVIVITHYHYDHYLPEDADIYRDKIILAKNPNEYINDSQRKRAEYFYEKIFRKYAGKSLEFKEKKKKDYKNPLEFIPIAANMDFGDYNKRRKELLDLGLKWFKNRVKNWNKWKEIPEINLDRIKVKWNDSRVFKFGETEIKFTEPLFHGIEFSRVGWVTALTIRFEGEKILYTSDLNGIYIEDYAEYIIKENPDVLILDGPPTYMKFMITKTNLDRCIRNTCRIIENAKNLKLIIYDHHLLREKDYREKTRKVWERGDEMKVKVLTAAEYCGKVPIIDQIVSK